MNLKLESKKNIAGDIASQYAKYIELGVLRGGDKLPSCRDLAVQLKINPNTVQHAYTILEQAGHIITLPHKGSFVKEKEADNINGANTSDSIKLIDYALEQIKELKVAGLTFEQLAETAKSVYFGFDAFGGGAGQSGQSGLKNQTQQTTNSERQVAAPTVALQDNNNPAEHITTEPPVAADAPGRPQNDNQNLSTNTPNTHNTPQPPLITTLKQKEQKEEKLI